MARGGARPGAGRKNASTNGKRVRITITVDPATRHSMDYLRKRGVKICQELGQMSDDYIHARLLEL